ncbi:uncharacterized protein LOC123552363 isoform X2 [Mercenaria mercenaria]|nr:uncharacterized protein LOC123552363 isoform X2 [Mercenaria mercenaria]
MQSGYWSAEPYCALPGDVTTSSPKSGMDETLILVIVLAVVGFLVAALIIFVCVAMFWGRNKNHYKKHKRYRDSTEYYLEDGSSQPYSISRKADDNMQMYHTNTIHPPNDDGWQHQHFSQPEDTDEVHHSSNGRRYQQNPDRRHFRYKCPRCIQKTDSLRQAHSLNDLADEAQREHHNNEKDEEKQIRDNRRDGYLWRRRSSLSNLNIPRPYYDQGWTPNYSVYYGPDMSPYI